jgi:hypothetical protein
MTRSRTRSKRLLLAAASLALALGACGLGPFGPAGPADELRAARAEWERRGIASYRYSISRSCGECVPGADAPARVEVRDGRTVSVTALVPARPIRPELFESFDTVEDLFATVEEVIAGRPYRFSASYDPRLGYPLEYSADLDREYVDDERGFVVQGFEVIR